jgi:hypothetical protein
MEPRGCNQWQSTANRMGAEVPKTWQGGGRRFDARQRALGKFLHSGRFCCARGRRVNSVRPQNVHRSAQRRRFEPLERSSRAALSVFRCDVHRTPRGLLGGESVEQGDGVLPPVAGEMAVVAVDHRHACADNVNLSIAVALAFAPLALTATSATADPTATVDLQLTSAS